MKQKPHAMSCPCGLPGSIDACCGRYLDHPETSAPTAEALMRSRYTAYTQQNADYLLMTWHPDTRPERLDLTESGGPVKWLGLSVVKCAAGLPGDLEGAVEFVACYKVGGRAYRMHEISRFVCQDGRWFYLDGDFTD